MSHAAKASVIFVKFKVDREVANASIIVIRIISHKVANTLCINSEVLEDPPDVGSDINSSMSLILRGKGKKEGTVLAASVHKVYIHSNKV